MSEEGVQGQGGFQAEGAALGEAALPAWSSFCAL